MHPDSSPGGQRQPTILLIEDEADQVAVLAALLQEAGCTVATAHTGVEGLSLVEEVWPDLVILDLKLPDLSGYRLLQVLKHAVVPVIVPACPAGPQRPLVACALSRWSQASRPAQGIMKAALGIGALVAAMSLPNMLQGGLARANFAPGVLATALNVWHAVPRLDAPDRLWLVPDVRQTPVVRSSTETNRTWRM